MRVLPYFPHGPQARFDSLLKLFGLEDRVVGSRHEVSAELTNGLLDWNCINRVCYRKAEEGKAFLARNLRAESSKTKYREEFPKVGFACDQKKRRRRGAR